MVRGSTPSAVPPKHSISAQRAAVRLEDYERELAKTLLPREDPVEAFYKPVDPQAHSYNPKPPVKAGMPQNGSPSAAARLRVPKMLRHYDPHYNESAQLDVAQSSLDASATDPPLSPNSREYQKLRRWNLPKGEWLQTAESGHPPGPIYRDMGASDRKSVV